MSPVPTHVRRVRDLRVRFAIRKIKHGPLQRQFRYWATGVAWGVANDQPRVVKDALAMIATLAFGLRDVLTPEVAGRILGAAFDDAKRAGLGDRAFIRYMGKTKNAHCDVGSGGCVTGGEWCVSDSTGCGGPSPGGGYGFGSRWTL